MYSAKDTIFLKLGPFPWEGVGVAERQRKTEPLGTSRRTVEREGRGVCKPNGEVDHSQYMSDVN